MSTQSQINANRRNATRSTGPRTSKGKARSSRNAIKLGLFAARLIIQPEERRTYKRFAAAWRHHAAPATPAEVLCVQQLISAAWRIRRCHIAESNLLDPDLPNQLDPMVDPRLCHIYDSIDRAQATAENCYRRAEELLKSLQTRRKMFEIERYLNPNAPLSIAAIYMKRIEGLLSPDAISAQLHNFSKRSQFDGPCFLETPLRSPRAAMEMAAA